MAERVDVAVVGGSGVTGVLDAPEPVEVPTAYGAVSLEIGTVGDRTVAFLPRHGEGHQVPPHRIDFRRNVAALGEITDRVVATAAVGGLDPDVQPGTFVLVDQFLDRTHGREATFFDDAVAHVDVTAPYCSQLRGSLADAASEHDLATRRTGTYVCTQGPRFETTAEIHAFRLLGGDVVGMTGVPEVVLARELGLCYATVATITNVAAGLTDAPLSHEEVLAVQAANTERLHQLLCSAVASLPGERDCDCAPPPRPM